MGIKFSSVTKEYILDLYNNSLISNSFWISNELYIENTYLIICDNMQVGLVQLHFGVFKNHRKYANVDMIELFSSCKYRGLGKITVAEIFKAFKLSTLFGEALASAIPFWYNIGANFEMNENKLYNEYILNGYSACFKLTKRSFEKH